MAGRTFRRELRQWLLQRIIIIIGLLICIGTEWCVLNKQMQINYNLRYETKLESFRMNPQTYFNPYRTEEVYDAEFRNIYESIVQDIRCFPVEKSYMQEVEYVDSWYGERTFGGDRVHEGTDVMDKSNTPGRIPVVSMTDGVIRNMGWLKLGGWRIGIESPQGIYYYYAHLYSYASGLKPGNTIYAGQLLGFMGNSGYGEEGTTGMFDVHLHIGIYFYEENGKEISINPYSFLRRVQGRG